MATKRIQVTHGTDCGVLCRHCEGTVWGFDTASDPDYISAQCSGCYVVDHLAVKHPKSYTLREMIQLHAAFRATLEPQGEV